jgi:hypothetical protein
MKECRMAISIEAKIAILLIHRENLAKARDFEEYRKLHIAYVDWLIDDLTADKMSNDAVEKFANNTTKETE